MEFHISTKTNENSSSALPQEEFPCPAILLDILENEHQQEKERAERLDNKAMALLTIIVALTTIYVPIFPFDKFVEFYTKSRPCFTIPVVLSIFLILGIIAIVVSICSASKLIGAYKTRDYLTVNIEQFNTNEKLAGRPADRFRLELIDHYQSIILENSEINANKAAVLNKQFQNIIIIFILLSLSAIGTLICIGL